METDEQYQEKIYGYGLADKYPEVFKYCRDRTRKTPFSHRGFELPKGWVHIVDELAQGIMSIPGIDIDMFEVLQVKEKFGGLRFYTSLPPIEVGGSEEIVKAVRSLIGDAEAKSYKTCEVCGAPAERDEDNVWMRTVCELHKKDFK